MTLKFVDCINTSLLVIVPTSNFKSNIIKIMLKAVYKIYEICVQQNMVMFIVMMINLKKKHNKGRIRVFIQ